MYSIYADGKLLFSTAGTDDEHIVLNPKLTLDANTEGELSFTLPPGNAFHGKLQKIKSIVTVEQDGLEIFRGRVMDESKDFYNQQSIYVEGDKAFLADSLFPPYEYSGSVQGFLQKVLTSHNGQVEAGKRFTIGEITAVSANETMEIEDTSYKDCYATIEDKLLKVFGGYFRTRKVGSTVYLDWLKEYGTNAQVIEFSVNLLDLKEKTDAGDVFTCLIPLGANVETEDGGTGEPLTIESVNSGKNYIQDDEAVALYGKIWRTQTWNYINKPAELLKKARYYMKTGAVLETLTIKAIDMHFLDKNVDSIRIGDNVRILSNPHGIDKTTICSKMVIDLLNPEKTSYTFGEKPRTLTDIVAKANKDLNGLTGGGRGGGGGKVEALNKEFSDLKRWADIFKDETEAKINLNAWEINTLTGRMTEVEFDMDGVKGEMLLRATKSELNAVGERVTKAEASIKLNTESIELKVSKDGVVSAINQTAEEIKIQAAKINLSGYVTASQLSATNASISNLTSGVTTASALKASLVNGTTVSGTYGRFDYIYHGGNQIFRRSIEVSTPSGSTTINYLGYN